MTYANTLLPIGSIILLKEATKKLMVVGILQKQEETTYDYIGVLYPEGYLNAQNLFLFNHEDIAEVSFLGFIGSEHQVFRNDLTNIMQGKKPAMF